MEPVIKNVSMRLVDDLKKTLSNIQIPELGCDAYSLGILKEVSFAEKLCVNIVLPSFGLRSEKDIAFAIKKVLVSHISDPSQIDLNFYSDVKPAAVQSINIPDIADVRNVILVSSGKGGVGKSSVSANLAVSLANLGCRVGLLDADVYGPSLPLMFGLQKDVDIKGFKDAETNTTFMIPPIKYDVALMSIGFLVDTESAMIWRGPMIASASMQMFHNVYWGQLDYLIVDLPPGTGDIQLTIAQKINVSGAIIVSTPQDMALTDVVRAKKMFDKVNIPILGLIENMSYFVCDSCDKRHEIFSNGGAKNKAEELGIKFLGEIPILPDIRSACDEGKPVYCSQSDNLAKPIFTDISYQVVAEITKKALFEKQTNNAMLNKIPPKPVENTEKKRRLPVL